MTSPTRKPRDAETLRAVPFTPARDTVRRLLSGTPEMVTVTSLPENVAETEPTTALAASRASGVPVAVTWPLNWNTIVCAAGAPKAVRGSTETDPASAVAKLIGTSKVPATPWVFLDTTLISERAPAAGVTLTVADDGPVPRLLVALTEQL